MSAPRDITPEDLALFAMQLLSKEDAAEVTANLEQSAEARRELARIQGDLAIYAHTVDLHSPPAQVRERLLRQVAKEKRTAPIERVERAAPVEIPRRVDTTHGGASGARSSGARKNVAAASVAANEEPELLNTRSSSRLLEDDLPKRSAGGKVFSWLGWAVAAVMAVAAGNLYRQRDSLYQERNTLNATVVEQATKLDNQGADTTTARQVLDALTDTTAKRVTLTKPKGAPAPLPQGRATYVANKGTLIFLANNLDPLPPLKTYELWLIPAEAGSTPIPAGTFRPDEHGNASVILPTLPKGIEAKAFGVTIEDKDGATTPTLPIILVGA
jgi:anti-sigma-K factor RskA